MTEDLIRLQRRLERLADGDLVLPAEGEALLVTLELARRCDTAGDRNGVLEYGQRLVGRLEALVQSGTADVPECRTALEAARQVRDRWAMESSRAPGAGAPLKAETRK